MAWCGVNSERIWLLCCDLRFLTRLQLDIEGDGSRLKAQPGCASKTAHLHGRQRLLAAAGSSAGPLAGL